jgi:hypothetical protein
VLGQAQSTAIATRFYSVTATPEPTRTPMPVLAEMAIATAIDDAGAPRSIVRSVAATGTMYVCAKIVDVQAGSQLVASLGTIDAQMLFSTELQATTTGGSQWFAFQWNLDGSVPPGRYAAYVFVDGAILESIVFTIT